MSGMRSLHHSKMRLISLCLLFFASSTTMTAEATRTTVTAMTSFTTTRSNATTTLPSMAKKTTDICSDMFTDRLQQPMCSQNATRDDKCLGDDPLLEGQCEGPFEGYKYNSSQSSLNCCPSGTMLSIVSVDCRVSEHKEAADPLCSYKRNPSLCLSDSKEVVRVGLDAKQCKSNDECPKIASCLNGWCCEQHLCTDTLTLRNLQTKCADKTKEMDCEQPPGAETSCEEGHCCPKVGNGTISKPFATQTACQSVIDCSLPFMYCHPRLNKCTYYGTRREIQTNEACAENDAKTCENGGVCVFHRHSLPRCWKNPLAVEPTPTTTMAVETTRKQTGYDRLAGARSTEQRGRSEELRHGLRILFIAALRIRVKSPWILVLLHSHGVEALSPAYSSLPTLSSWLWVFIMSICLMVMGANSAPSALQGNSKRARRKKGKKEGRKRRSLQPRKSAFQQQLSRGYFVLWRSSFLKEADFHLAINFAKSLMKNPLSSKQIQQLIATLQSKIACKDGNSEDANSKKDDDDGKRKKKKEEDEIAEDTTQKSSRKQKQKAKNSYSNNHRRKKDEKHKTRPNNGTFSSKGSSSDDDDDRDNDRIRANIPHQKKQKKKKASAANGKKKSSNGEKDSHSDDFPIDDGKKNTKVEEDENKHLKARNQLQRTHETITNASGNYPSGAFFSMRNSFRRVSQSMLSYTEAKEVAVVSTTLIDEKRYNNLMGDLDSGSFLDIIFVNAKGAVPDFVQLKYTYSFPKWGLSSTFELPEIMKKIKSSGKLGDYLRSLSVSGRPVPFFLLYANRECVDKETNNSKTVEKEKSCDGCGNTQERLEKIPENVETLNGVEFL